MARHNEIGKIGEDLASKWLTKKGFTIIDRNYSRKWGEIDIVARETTGRVHFVEVKSVSYETRRQLEWAVTHETYRPEDNVHANKQRRLKKAIQTWILDKRYKGQFQIDIITVRIVLDERFARVNYLDDVVFE
jgi:putative endonuclease